MPLKGSKKRVREEEEGEEKKMPMIGDESDADEEEFEVVKPALKKMKALEYTIKIPKWSKNLRWDETIPYMTEYNAHRQMGANRHMTDLAGEGKSGTTKNLVPPMHADWDTKLFKFDMRLDKFLHVLATNKTILEIMKWEVDYEVSMTDTVEDTSKSAHFNKSMQWKSWSAMLQLEITYPTLMMDCRSFDSCIQMVWAKYLSTKAKKISATRYNLATGKMLGDFNTIIEYVWADAGVVKPSPPNTFVRKKLMPALKESNVYKDHFEDKHKLEAAWIELVKYGPLQIPKAIQSALRSAGQDVVARALQAPQTIHESVISSGVKRLVLAIWGEDMDTTQPIELEIEKIGLSEKAKSVACLLELLCGSRMLGLLLVNWFSPIETGTMEEWQRDSLPKTFGSMDRCILTTRLSKEGTRAARQAKRKGTKNPEDAPMDRMIVKPLNTMFLDRVFLAPEKNFTRTLTKDQTAVKIFLHLVTVLREYIFDPEALDVRGLESIEKGGMLGLTDEMAEKLPKRARSWIGNAEHGINMHARKIFPGMFKKGQGSHLFRKIYMLWSYKAFASDKMKETGYASAVLGHRGFKVSLNYTSLLIQPSVAGDAMKNANLLETLTLLEKRMDGLNARMIELKKKPTVEDLITFTGINGNIVQVPRPKRGEHVTELLGRTILFDHGVKATWGHLNMLGVWKKRKVKPITSEDTIAFAGINGNIVHVPRPKRGEQVTEQQGRAILFDDHGVKATWENLNKLGVWQKRKVKPITSEDIVQTEIH
jgi:hypothetical protein